MINIREDGVFRTLEEIFGADIAFIIYEYFCVNATNATKEYKRLCSSQVLMNVIQRHSCTSRIRRKGVYWTVENFNLYAPPVERPMILHMWHLVLCSKIIMNVPVVF